MRALLAVCQALLLLATIAAAKHNAHKLPLHSSSSVSTAGTRALSGFETDFFINRNSGARSNQDGHTDAAVEGHSPSVAHSNFQNAITNTRSNGNLRENQERHQSKAGPIGVPFKGTCGVTEAHEHRGRVPGAPAAPRIRRRRAAPQQDLPKLLRLSGGDVRGTRRYVEVHLVADSRLYRRLTLQRKTVEDFAAGVISYTNAMFEPLEISVVLKRLEVWRNGDKTSITSNHDGTLENFKPHRLGLLRKGVDSDVTVLLTDMDFEGTTIGYALVSSMCSSTAIAVVQTHDSDVVSVSHTVAHELGHVLGMNHDKAFCTCDDMSCVMYEELNGAMKPAVKWSNCSKIHLASHFVHGEFSCLQDIPTLERGRLEFCGDGIVDEGEQCDCGPPDMCSSPCCDPHTCTFLANATCASGPCCDLQTCRPAATSTPCRHRRSECDLPEFCSGWSELCPHDSYMHDGSPCDDGQGHCVSGKCGSHRMRCETLFGPGTVASPDRCFANNVQGREGQNCGMYRSSTTYRRCERDSVKCGSIYCDPVTSMIIPRAGVMLWANSAQCFTAYAQNISAVPGLELAPDGSICGDGKMCVDQRCIPVPPPPEGCVQVGCGDHGVCNNWGRCHCDAGYGPPDCTGPGFGGSVDSGHMSDPTVTSDVDRMLFLVLLVFIPLICGACALFCCLNVYWTNYKKQVDLGHYPFEDKIDSYLCCLSSTINNILVESGILGEPNPCNNALSGDPSETEKLNPPLSSERRNTICQVDVDIQTPKPAPNSWGTASDALFTDVVTVKPKSSPDLHRRVRLPSDSPLLHHRSQDHLQRPKYDKSFSSDSGCVSDLEDQREKADTNMSMSSLVNLVMKVGKGKRSREGSSEPEARNPKQYVTQKSVPLSRLVLDPYVPKTNLQQENDSFSNNKRPALNRSISSDASATLSVKLNIPESGFLTPKKSSTSINTVSSSDSESFYVNYTSENQPGGNTYNSSSKAHPKPVPGKAAMKPTPKLGDFVATRKAPSVPSLHMNKKTETSNKKIAAENSKPPSKKPMLPPHLNKKAEATPASSNGTSAKNSSSSSNSAKLSPALPGVQLKPKVLGVVIPSPPTKNENQPHKEKEFNTSLKNQTSTQTKGNIPSNKNDAPRRPMLPPSMQKFEQSHTNGSKQVNNEPNNLKSSPTLREAKLSVSDSTKISSNSFKSDGNSSPFKSPQVNCDAGGEANEFITKFRQMKSGASSTSNVTNPVTKAREANPARKPMMPPTKRLL